MPAPEVIIKAIRQSFIGSEQVYQNGSCIMFYLILKALYPKAKPYWSKTAKHCITRIGSKYYDITGAVRKTTDYEIDDQEEYANYPIAVAFPQTEQQRFTFTTPRKL